MDLARSRSDVVSPGRGAAASSGGGIGACLHARRGNACEFLTLQNDENISCREYRTAHSLSKKIKFFSFGEAPLSLRSGFNPISVDTIVFPIADRGALALA